MVGDQLGSYRMVLIYVEDCLMASWPGKPYIWSICPLHFDDISLAWFVLVLTYCTGQYIWMYFNCLVRFSSSWDYLPLFSWNLPFQAVAVLHLLVFCVFYSMDGFFKVTFQHRRLICRGSCECENLFIIFSAPVNLNNKLNMKNVKQYFGSRCSKSYLIFHEATFLKKYQ